MLILISWAIAYIISISIVVYGIIIFFNRNMTNEVDYKEVTKFFIIISILKVFDSMSTVHFASKIGTEHEANIMIRFLMDYFGILPGVFLSNIILIPVLFFVLVATNYQSKINKINLFKGFVYLAIIGISVVILINMSI